MISTFAFPTKVYFGEGALNSVSEILDLLGVRKPLIVTDAGIVKSGLADQLIEQVKRGGRPWALFDGVEPNPTEQSVFPGVDLFKAEGCDGILAIGGGSPLDAGKAIRLKIHHPLALELYDDLKNGEERITEALPSMVAIATTSGTGSEISRSTVIALRSTGRKTVIFSPRLIPTVAIGDPLLTLGLPPHITAATGMDAMTHNVETYLARGFHPFCDAIAIRGVEIVARYLRRAVKDGRDREARSWMMIASMMGALAFQKGLGATHSLAHPLSTEAGLHHGLSNAVMLPHVIRFNIPACPAERESDVARALGVDTRGLAPEEAGEAAARAIELLNQDIGIPSRLSLLKVRADQIDLMSSKAMEDGCHLLNPRPCTREDMASLYRRAL